MIDFWQPPTGYKVYVFPGDHPLRPHLERFSHSVDVDYIREIYGDGAFKLFLVDPRGAVLSKLSLTIGEKTSPLPC